VETTVRAATPADAEAIARIHVGSWRDAYTGLVPDGLLAALSVERRTTMWTNAIARAAEEESEERVWVAERDGIVIGFASTGPTGDDDAPPGTAEIFTIYVEPDVVGTGAGRALFVHANDDFRRRGFRQASLWVLASNERTRRFYEAGGWRPDGSVKAEAFGDWSLDVARYRVSL
jgi:L-amino acid N-acyltransferase YncA